MLRDARSAGLRLCFVRVQRRPEDGRPPYPVARRLQGYVAKLSAYIQQRGGVFVDDTGDYAQALSWSTAMAITSRTRGACATPSCSCRG